MKFFSYTIVILCAAEFTKQISKGLARKLVKKYLQMSYKCGPNPHSFNGLTKEQLRLLCRYNSKFTSLRYHKTIKLYEFSSCVYDRIFNNQVVNFIIDKVVTPKADYLTISPFYMLTSTKDNIKYEFLLLENSYEIICKKLFLARGSFDKIDKHYTYKDLLINIVQELSSADSEFTKILKVVKEKLLYFNSTDDSSQFIKKLIDGLVSTENITISEYYDESIYKDLMPVLNDLYNIMNLYTKVVVSKVKEESRFVIINIDESVVDDICRSRLDIGCKIINLILGVIVNNFTKRPTYLYHFNYCIEENNKVTE